MSDQTLAHLKQLAPEAAEAAYWLVWATRTAGYPVVITSSRRTRATQRALVKSGRSRTLRSAHLAGLAFDIDWYGTRRDDVPAEFWQLVGPWAERYLDLGWGGRWKSPYDPGHFEVIRANLF